MAIAVPEPFTRVGEQGENTMSDKALRIRCHCVRQMCEQTLTATSSGSRASLATEIQGTIVLGREDAICLRDWLEKFIRGAPDHDQEARHAA